MILKNGARVRFMGQDNDAIVIKSTNPGTRWDGIYAENTDPDSIEFEYVDIQDAEYAFHLSQDAGAMLKNVTLSDTSSILVDDGTLRVDAGTLTLGDSTSVTVSSDGTLDLKACGSIAFGTDDLIEVHGTANLHTDLTLPANNELYFKTGATTNVYDGAILSVDGELNIEGGSEFLFESTTPRSRFHITSGGRIFITGADTSKARFACMDPAGRWDGIWLQNTQDEDIDIAHAGISEGYYGLKFYEGGQGQVRYTTLIENWVGLYVNSVYDVLVDSVRFIYNDHNGIEGYGSDFVLENSVLDDNDRDGLVISGNSEPEVRYTTFCDNDQGLVVKSSNSHIDAGYSCSGSSKKGNNVICSNDDWRLLADRGLIDAYANYWEVSQIPWDEIEEDHGGVVDADCPLSSPPQSAPPGMFVVNSAMPGAGKQNAGPGINSGSFGDSVESDSVKGLFNLGRALRDQHDFASAEALFKRIINQHPEHPRARFAVGQLIKNMYRARKAGRSVGGGLSGLRAYLGTVRDQHLTARNDLHQAALSALVNVARREGEGEQALPVVAQILTLYPNSRLAEEALFDRFGIDLNRLGDRQAAAATLNELKAAFPESDYIAHAEISLAARNPGEKRSTSQLAASRPGSAKLASLADIEDALSLPSEFQLLPSFPNPFNPAAAIRYHIPTSAESNLVAIRVYDLLGRLVRTLVNDVQGPGIHTVAWDGRDDLGNEVASGVYLVRLQAGDFVQARKMTLMR